MARDTMRLADRPVLPDLVPAHAAQGSKGSIADLRTSKVLSSLSEILAFF
jgi:hypothetical protein